MGDSLGALSRTEEAHAAAVKATGILEAALGPNHPYTLVALGNQTMDSPDSGPEVLERSLAICEEVLRRRQAVLPPNHADIALAHYQVAAKLGRLKRHAEALDAYLLSFAIYAEEYGADHPYLDENRISEAEMLVPLGRHPEAETRLRQVVAHAGLPDANPLVIALAQFRLADLLVGRDPGQAVALAQAAHVAAQAAGANSTLDDAQVVAWLQQHEAAAPR
jgi:hypothetical protein